MSSHYRSETSPLKAIGYKVGANSISERGRRVRLKRIYSEILLDPQSMQPAAEFTDLDPDYLLDWGEPSSPERLQKIANFLAIQARTFKLRGRTMAEAAKHYEADLEWLKEEFFDSSCHKFPWPDMRV